MSRSIVNSVTVIVTVAELLTPPCPSEAVYVNVSIPVKDPLDGEYVRVSLGLSTTPPSVPVVSTALTVRVGLSTSTSFDNTSIVMLEVPCDIATASFCAIGSSFTSVTVTVTVPSVVAPTPSNRVYLKDVSPAKSAAGVKRT